MVVNAVHHRHWPLPMLKGDSVFEKVAMDEAGGSAEREWELQVVAEPPRNANLGRFLYLRTGLSAHHL